MGVVVNPLVAPPAPVTGGQVVDKGLRRGAIGFISSVVIGVASTAPGYSLAATLGLIVAAVGFQAPAALWVAFIPMLCIASAYLYMNRTDPDCGLSCPSRIRSSVVFPAPLGPMMPTLSPRMMLVEKSRSIDRSP